MLKLIKGLVIIARLRLLFHSHPINTLGYILILDKALFQYRVPHIGETSLTIKG